MDLSRAGSAILDVFFGQMHSCPVCGRLTNRCTLCDECMSRIPMVSSPVCSACGTPLKAASSGNLLCNGCSRTHRYFERARAACVYEGAAREHVHDLKYRARVEIVPALSRMMAHCAIKGGIAGVCDCAVPVPMHPDKLAARGFNQAELLARCVASLIGIPLMPKALSRRARTGTQTFLDRTGRRGNVLHAFVCDEPAGVAGRVVLLIDDVLTSGATADGCARALLRSGACEVNVLTFAVSVADERDWMYNRS